MRTQDGHNGAANAENQGKREFSVWRLDDNNNEFLVRDGMTEHEALALVQDFEGRGHRQAYWVKREADSSST